ncbi:G-protein beta WD-40 repeats containing protein, partial [Reticulomyxa filosa]
DSTVEIEKLNTEITKMSEEIKKMNEMLEFKDKQLLEKEEEIQTICEQLIDTCTSNNNKEKQTPRNMTFDKSFEESTQTSNQNDDTEQKESSDSKPSTSLPKTYTEHVFDALRALKLRKAFRKHAKCVYSIHLSSFENGKYLGSGSHDKTVRIWDVNTTKELVSFEGHSEPVHCVKFSDYHYNNNHGVVIASASNDKTICLWNLTTKKMLATLKGHQRGVKSIQFSSFSGGRYLCSGSNDKYVFLWDVGTYRLLYAFSGHTDNVYCVDVSPLHSTAVRLWDVDTNKGLTTFKGHTGFVYSVKYSPYDGGNIICSGSYDKTVRLWDVRSGQEIQTLNGHSSWISCVDYLPFIRIRANIDTTDANIICSGSADKTICFWDVRNNKQLFKLTHETEIYCVQFPSAKGTKGVKKAKLCYGGGDGRVQFWM